AIARTRFAMKARLRRLYSGSHAAVLGAVQDRLGLRTVRCHLCTQRIRRTELRILAHESDEFDFKGFSIEISVEIEEEGFEKRQASVEGRPCPEIGRALQLFAAAIGMNRVNTVLERHPLLKADVGGRKAKALSAPGAALDKAFDPPRVAKHL